MGNLQKLSCHVSGSGIMGLKVASHFGKKSPQIPLTSASPVTTAAPGIKLGAKIRWSVDVDPL
jgi:hypothetical protein